jgi:hypothetical protein
MEYDIYWSKTGQCFGVLARDKGLNPMPKGWAKYPGTREDAEAEGLKLDQTFLTRFASNIKTS